VNHAEPSTTRLVEVAGGDPIGRPMGGTANVMSKVDPLDSHNRDKILESPHENRPCDNCQRIHGSDGLNNDVIKKGQPYTKYDNLTPENSNVRPKPAASATIAGPAGRAASNQGLGVGIPQTRTAPQTGSNKRPKLGNDPVTQSFTAGLGNVNLGGTASAANPPATNTHSRTSSDEYGNNDPAVQAAFTELMNREGGGTAAASPPTTRQSMHTRGSHLDYISRRRKT
jgi:hypothetical protein